MYSILPILKILYFSAQFRMCPSYNRKGFEVLTTQGQEKPDSQSATINYEKVNDLKR